MSSKCTFSDPQTRVFEQLCPQIGRRKNQSGTWLRLGRGALIN
jgi:hypothetical protein